VGEISKSVAVDGGVAVPLMSVHSAMSHKARHGDLAHLGLGHVHGHSYVVEGAPPVYSEAGEVVSCPRRRRASSAVPHEHEVVDVAPEGVAFPSRG
jgi:hypothetical protein